MLVERRNNRESSNGVEVESNYIEVEKRIYKLHKRIEKKGGSLNVSRDGCSPGRMCDEEFDRVYI